jgi:hypothetical protein
MSCPLATIGCLDQNGTVPADQEVAHTFRKRQLVNCQIHRWLALEAEEPQRHLVPEFDVALLID